MLDLDAEFFNLVLTYKIYDYTGKNYFNIKKLLTASSVHQTNPSV